MSRFIVDEIVFCSILDRLNVFYDDIAIPSLASTGRPEVSYGVLFRALLEYDGTKDASQALGLSKSSLETFISRHMQKFVLEKGANTKWSTYLLGLEGLGRCITCGIIAPIKDIKSGKNNTCPSCVKHRSKLFRVSNPESVRTISRRYREKHPEKIKEIYRRWQSKNIGYLRNKGTKRRLAEKHASVYQGYGSDEEDQIIALYQNTPEGYHVDHIIPLQHPLVCGLHVLRNLQYLPAKDNLMKSNKFEPYTITYALQQDD